MTDRLTNTGECVLNTAMQQKTLKRQFEVSGQGLHTGQSVRVIVKPASENTGIVFQRTDVRGHPCEIPALVQYVDDVVRGTTLSKDGVKIHTVEHLMSALYGSEIDNARIEIDGSEVPILDGSAKFWVEKLQEVGFELQLSEKTFVEIMEPISLVQEDRSILILPNETFQITCTSADNRGVHVQHLTLTIDHETYVHEIADARTFTLYEDVEPLLKLGKIKGGSLDCAIVIKGDKILSNGPLRFTDEFVRHKILDIVGDLALLGHPIKGHIIAIKTGHALNIKLCKAILEQFYQENLSEFPVYADAVLDIQGILKHLPHRYPFILVDRVISIEEDVLRAIKNVTANEPYFVGHFPGNPIMPGVLQLEAMAQAAGILMGYQLGQENKNAKAFLMSADKVKFRNVVQPGDQMLIEVRLLKIKNNRIGIAEGQCFVNDKMVSSAELMFMISQNQP